MDGEPLVLGLETGSSVETIALIQGDLLLAEQRVRRPRGRGTGLAGEVSRLLAAVERNPSDLAAIAVGVGPGAFTSLRVSLALAQGLATGLGIPAFPFPSAPSWAAGSGAVERAVAVVLDARRGEVWAGLFDVDACGQPTARIAEGLHKPGEFFTRLAEEPDGSLLLVGDGAVLHGELARAHLGGRGIVHPLASTGPSAAFLARQALRALHRGEAPNGPLLPRYLRDATEVPPAGA